MGAFGIVAGPLLLPLMTGKQFHAFAWPAAWGALTESVRMINFTYGLVAHARLKIPLPNIVLIAAIFLIFGLYVLMARWILAKPCLALGETS
ncbi:MAG TPA: hypothetical protein VNK24_06645 [Elusimicrobiota bacterium]|nr:hypothetical protein [Elusimicrobiota bacterium]